MEIKSNITCYYTLHGNVIYPMNPNINGTNQLPSPPFKLKIQLYKKKTKLLKTHYLI